MEGVHFGIDDPRWREALGRLRHDFYHLPEYSRLEAETNDAHPMAFSAVDGERELFVPYLVRRCDHLFPNAGIAGEVRDVVSPYGYPGFLLSDAARDSSEFCREVLQCMAETFREQGVCSAFFRMNSLLSERFASLFPPELLSEASDTIAIDLALSEEVIWEKTRHGHQWVINKCKKLGYEPRMVAFSEHIDAFMEVYQETMDRVKARDNYYFGRDYFLQLAAMPSHVHCCLVEFEGEVAAACVFFECSGIVQAHLGGTRSKYMKQSPFHLVLHHTAGWAKSRGNRYFHLGGGVGGSGDRLLEFKRGFSELTFPFHTLRLITDKAKYRELTALRAQAANLPSGEPFQTEYFPAYRAPL